MSDKFRQRPIEKLVVERVEGGSVTLNPRKDLAISSNLTEEMKIQPSLMGWYGELLEEAQYVMKWRKYEWTAHTEARYRAYHEENQAKPKTHRLTETAIKKLINEEEDTQAAIEAYMEAAHTHRRLKFLYDALVEKGHMLRSINKNERDQHRFQD